MALTKIQIAEYIQNQLNFPKAKSSEVVEILIELIKSKLEKGEDILISGYGKFCVKEKKERKGRNPATGDDLILGKRRVVTFKCSGSLRELINDSK